MSGDWKSFFFAKLPMAALLVAGIVQLLGMGLSHVPLRRFDTDGLADAILADPSQHQVVLFGDSIARNGTRFFRLGDQDRILNLSTHAFFGLTGDILLLKRYLTTHKAPYYVVVVSAPSLYTEVPDFDRTQYYLWNVFKQPQERAYLRGKFPKMGADDILPDILRLQQAVVEPLISLAIGGKAHYYTLGSDPKADPKLEPASTNLASADAIDARINSSMAISPIQATELRELCDLSASYQFKIDIVWAPLPLPLVKYWRSIGAIRKLQSQILVAMGGQCSSPNFMDTNEKIAFLAFDHQGLHVRGEGWQEYFSYTLKAHINELLGVSD